MRGITHFRDVPEGFSLPAEFVDHVLGSPKCTVEQASYSAHDVEQDRIATLLWQKREAWNDYLRALSEQRQASEKVNAAFAHFRELEDRVAAHALEEALCTVRTGLQPGS